jgi:Toxic anion resistance protein (TelA)
VTDDRRDTEARSVAPPTPVPSPTASRTAADAHDLPDAAPADLGAALRPDVAAKIESLAIDFVDALCAAPVGSPAFGRAARAIDGLGSREVAATTAIAMRFQDRPVRAVEAMLGERGPLSRHLAELRRIASDMVRRTANDRIGFEAVTSHVFGVEDRIRALLESLDAERAALEADNAGLGQQERALWLQIEALREYAFLAERLDELVGRRVEALAATDPGAAQRLQLEGLYAIRRRRRDLLLQLAVASQGYSALRLIEQDNLEVVWAIRAATTTTATALRTALVAGRAAAGRSPGRRAGDAADAVASLRGTLAEMVTALDTVEQRRRTTLDEVHRGPRDPAGASGQ